jgi:N-acyl-D-amino-acid deacylase
MNSVLFRGCDVIDGTGAPRLRADVAVSGGRIAAVGDTAAAAARDTDRVADASGLVLAPGFIDMHAHSDLALLTDGRHLAKTAQGVTLEVLGQDGLNYAPNDDDTLKQLRRQLAGWSRSGAVRPGDGGRSGEFRPAASNPFGHSARSGERRIRDR